MSQSNVWVKAALYLVMMYARQCPVSALSYSGARDNANKSLMSRDSVLSRITAGHVVARCLFTASRDLQNVNILTFSSHADLETFLESTVLALIAMVLIDGTVATTAARVCEITSN